MFEPQTIVPKKDPVLVGESPSPRLDRPNLNGPNYDAKQRRLMQIALALLLVALGSILYRNRDFWFPDTQVAESDLPAESSPDTAAPTQPAPVVEKAPAPALKSAADSFAQIRAM